MKLTSSLLSSSPSCSRFFTTSVAEVVVVLSSFLLLVGGAGGTTTSCNKLGGSAVTWDEGCDARDYTYTEWCDVVETKDETTGNATSCRVTPNGCGCQIIYPDGNTNAVGSGSVDGCSNACVDISTDVPQDLNCSSSGSALSFIGECDSRNLTFSPQCTFSDSTDDNGNQICFIEASSCGCLYWDMEDPTFISGLGDSKCDGCVAGGANPDLSTNPNAPSGAIARRTCMTTTAATASVVIMVGSALSLLVSF